MTTVLSGLVSTDDIQADERIVDMSERINGRFSLNLAICWNILRAW